MQAEEKPKGALQDESLGQTQDPVELRRKKQRRHRIAGAAALVVIAAIAIVLQVLGNDARQGSSVTVDERVMSGVVESGSINKVLSAYGTVAAADEEDVSVPGNIRVTKYHVSAGDTVKKGDVIATVDRDTVLAAIADVQQLIDELDAEAEELKDSSSSSTIDASADGTVVKIYAEEGKAVEDVMYEHGALMLVSLDGLLAMKVDNDGGLTIGDAVRVVGSDGEAHDGKVAAIGKEDATITVSLGDFSFDEKVTAYNASDKELGSDKLSIFNQQKITGYSGTVSSIYVAEGSTVSSGDALIALTDTDTEADYQLLLKRRKKLVEQADRLAKINKTGYVYAEGDGVITSLNEELLPSSSKDADEVSTDAEARDEEQRAQEEEKTATQTTASAQVPTASKMTNASMQMAFTNVASMSIATARVSQQRAVMNVGGQKKLMRTAGESMDGNVSAQDVDVTSGKQEGTPNNASPDEQRRDVTAGDTEGNGDGGNTNDNENGNEGGDGNGNGGGNDAGDGDNNASNGNNDNNGGGDGGEGNGENGDDNGGNGNGDGGNGDNGNGNGDDGDSGGDDNGSDTGGNTGGDTGGNTPGGDSSESAPTNEGSSGSSAPNEEDQHSDKKVTKTVNVIWLASDGNILTSGTPDSVTVVLSANGKAIEKVAVSEGTDWSASFTVSELDENGSAIKYEIKLAGSVNGYSASTSTSGNKTNIVFKKDGQKSTDGDKSSSASSASSPEQSSSDAVSKGSEDANSKGSAGKMSNGGKMPSGGSGFSAGSMDSGNLLTEEGATIEDAETVEENPYAYDETVLCAVSLNDAVSVDVSVDELDIGRVVVGSAVRVSLDALPGRSFDGKITALNPFGENSGGNTKYTVTVSMDKQEDVLIGMNAQVRSNLEEHKNVLLIPESALVEQDGKTYVYTSYDEAADELGGLTEVQTGIADGENVEITGGLETGQTYYYRYADSMSYEFKRA